MLYPFHIKQVDCSYQLLSPHLFLFSNEETCQSCNNPLRSVEACCEADSAAVFTSEAMPTSGFFIMSSPRPNVEFSSSSFLCNPRSKLPRKREWILRSNKHTFSDGKKLNSFFFIFLLQVSSVSSLKDRPGKTFFIPEHVKSQARRPYCLISAFITVFLFPVVAPDNKHIAVGIPGINLIVHLILPNNSERFPMKNHRNNKEYHFSNTFFGV